LPISDTVVISDSEKILPMMDAFVDDASTQSACKAPVLVVLFSVEFAALKFMVFITNNLDAFSMQLLSNCHFQIRLDFLHTSRNDKYFENQVSCNCQ